MTLLRADKAGDTLATRKSQDVPCNASTIRPSDCQNAVAMADFPVET